VLRAGQFGGPLTPRGNAFEANALLDAAVVELSAEASRSRGESPVRLAVRFIC
jgi:hypothetical protein